MSKTRKILLLPGDGIGQVIAEVRKILDWMNKTKSLDCLSQELIEVHLSMLLKFQLQMGFL